MQHDPAQPLAPSHARAIDRRAAARDWMAMAEALLARFDAHRALERFEAAVIVLRGTDDVAGRATALLGMARALQMLGDPSARNAYEDAGDLFDDIGDETTVRAIDRELRAIEAEMEESPRSFQSRPPFQSSAAVTMIQGSDGPRHQARTSR